MMASTNVIEAMIDNNLRQFKCDSARRGVGNRAACALGEYRAAAVPDAPTPTRCGVAGVDRRPAEIGSRTSTAVSSPSGMVEYGLCSTFDARQVAADGKVHMTCDAS